MFLTKNVHIEHIFHTIREKCGNFIIWKNLFEQFSEVQNHSLTVVNSILRQITMTHFLNLNQKIGVILLMEEILHHPICMKPCKQWDKLRINWCRISSMNSNILFLRSSLFWLYTFHFKRTWQWLNINLFAWCWNIPCCVTHTCPYRPCMVYLYHIYTYMYHKKSTKWYMY